MQGNPYHRIRGQMLAVLLGFGLLPLGAMGVAGYLANRDSAGARARSALEAMVRNRKVTVEYFLRESQRGIGTLAAALPVAELSKREVLAAVRDDSRREGGALVDLGLISDRGRHVAYVGPYKLEHADYSGEAWFQQVLLRGSYASDVFLGFRRFPHLVVAVKKREGGRDWILRATLDTDALGALVREGGLEVGAELSVLNRRGEVQVSSSDELRPMERADLGPVPLHSGVRIEEVARGRGRELVATAWLKGQSWVLVGRQAVPRPSLLLLAHPAVSTVFVAGLLGVVLLSFLVSRARLRQFRALEAERASLYASVAQAQKMAAIGRMAASIAHEVNSPLANIGAQVGVVGDLVKEHPALPCSEELRSRIQKIEAQLERGRKITHRLLGFSRRVGPEREPVDVAAALDETVSLLEKELEAEQIEVLRDYDRELPAVESSLAQMQQVFLNLINHAVDAVGGKGQLWLLVRSHEGGVQVKIAHSGPGLSPEEQRRAFDAAAGEPGLGLAICREIVAALDGRVELEGGGARPTFSLWFPFRPKGSPA